MHANWGFSLLFAYVKKAPFEPEFSFQLSSSEKSLYSCYFSLRLILLYYLEQEGLHSLSHGMNWCNGSKSLCRGAGTHPRWSNGSHRTCETRHIWLQLYFSICENKCCRSTNSVAWTFDSGRTIRVENVFPFVVFTSSQLILFVPVSPILLSLPMPLIFPEYSEKHMILCKHILLLA